MSITAAIIADGAITTYNRQRCAQRGLLTRIDQWPLGHSLSYAYWALVIGVIQIWGDNPRFVEYLYFSTVFLNVVY